MKASALEFRYRFLVHVVLYALGFLAPWNYLLHLDNGQSLWLPAVMYLERAGLLNLIAASNALLIAGIVFALLGAALRTWGTAYIHASVVFDGTMHGSAVVADGPYRHLRNPLYLGTWLHTFALALLMPPSGAVFAILAIGFEQLRLIAGEEAFLIQRLGQSYLDYRSRVPSLFPSLRSRVPASGTHPAWLTAILGESYMWGVVIAFAAAGWRYNASLVTQGVVIALGLSLVLRAFIPRPATASL